MQLRSVLMTVSMIGALAVASMADPKSDKKADAQTPIQKELFLYYREGKVPDWREAIKRISSEEKAVERRRSASYLCDLLDQALKDELSGTAPWRATPFWDGVPDNPARNLREEIVEAIAKGASIPAAVPVCQWFFDHEDVSTFQATAMTGLLKVRTDEANKLLIDQVSHPHRNAAVLVMALQTVGNRKLKINPEKLAALYHCPRSSVRRAARDVNAKLGLPKPAPFDPVQAMQSKVIRSLVKQISSIIIAPAPANAKFVIIKTKLEQGQRNRIQEARGWLLEETKKAYVIFTPSGRRRNIPKRVEPSDANMGISQTATMKEIHIAEEVRRIVPVRKKNDPNFELSERGPATGQFLGHGAGLHEIILGHWLYTNKKYKLAAEMLLPALDSFYVDAHLVDMVRLRLGDVYGYQMLVAFVGDRDYDRTLKLAKFLTEHCKKTRFYKYAKRLQTQIPSRRDDFKKLTLPTPAEWKKMKQKMSRKEQIRFLCDRMRLLNCFQWGQPGGTSYSQTQYREPGGMSEDAAWGGRPSGTEVINPYAELPVEVPGTAKAEKTHHLRLTIADIPILAPYLKEDWFIPTVTFWRDFHPNRDLHRTRPIFCELINMAAGYVGLCEIKKLDKMSDKDLDEHIRKVIAWAKASENDKIKVEMPLKALRECLAQRDEWCNLYAHAVELVHHRDRRVLPLLRKYVETRKPCEVYAASAIDLILELDPAQARAAATRYLKTDNAVLEITVGKVLLKTNDVAGGRRKIAHALAHGSRYELRDCHILDAVQVLLKEGSQESKRAAAGVLSRTMFASRGFGDRPEILREFLKADMPEAYEFYLRMLKNKTNKLGDEGHSGDTFAGEKFWVAEVYAEEVIREFGPENPALHQIGEKTRGNRNRQIAAVEQWLRAQIKTLKKSVKGQ